MKITNINGLLTSVLKLYNPKYINIYHYAVFFYNATTRKAYKNSLELHVFHALWKTVKNYCPLNTGDDRMHCWPQPKAGVKSATCRPQLWKKIGFIVAKKWPEIFYCPNSHSLCWVTQHIFIKALIYINPALKEQHQTEYHVFR